MAGGGIVVVRLRRAGVAGVGFAADCNGLAGLVGLVVGGDVVRGVLGLVVGGDGLRGVLGFFSGAGVFHWLMREAMDWALANLGLAVIGAPEGFCSVGFFPVGDRGLGTRGGGVFLTAVGRGAGAAVGFAGGAAAVFVRGRRLAGVVVGLDVGGFMT